MKLQFTKMQGCGNDYVYINGFDTQIPADKKENLVKFLSDRHFGIGGDGVIFINPSSIADFEMEMYNQDGSRGEMCGNGIRCVARYVYDHGMTKETSFTIESCKKIKQITLTLSEGEVSTVRVDMGSPILTARDIPVISDHEQVIHQEITVMDKVFYMTCVSMGNPHAVVFTDPDDILVYGPSFEHHPLFPKRVNTEFVEILDRKNVRMRVYERGTGETLACGTGCCAVAAACILNQLTEDEITIHVPGGDITVFWDRQENRIYMSGPARAVFSGEIELKEDFSI